MSSERSNPAASAKSHAGRAGSDRIRSRWFAGRASRRTAVRSAWLLAGFVAVLLARQASWSHAAEPRSADPPAVRRFVFRYRFQLVHLDRFLQQHRSTDGDKTVRIWIPLARSTRFQHVVSAFPEPAAPADSSAVSARAGAASAVDSRSRRGSARARLVELHWDEATTETFRRDNPVRLPGPARVLRDPEFGNRVLFVEVRPQDPSRPVTIEIPYCVARQEVRSRDLDALPAEKLSDVERRLFLRANSKVPVGGKPLSLLQGIPLHRKNPLQLARDLYQVVEANLTYKKVGSGWGRGDVLWVCDSRYGNCTDFHSLFISLARAQGIPAKFVIGFPVPREPASGAIGGYHCWAWFFAEGRGWRPVDISEADKHPELKGYYFGNLTADRIQFTTGRDIDLNRLVCEAAEPRRRREGVEPQEADGRSRPDCAAPRSVAPPLNYFIYPHVEVAGRVLDQKFISLQMSYCNVDADCLCAAAETKRGRRVD
ncbi:MAG: transglutaminase domain-containing protein [Planctomycetota bacterium]|nr:MAG: transglutaminase domain-containing protein [Planctomycetota bacterium]